jgi:hypothetical protein
MFVLFQLPVQRKENVFLPRRSIARGVHMMRTEQEYQGGIWRAVRTFKNGLGNVAADAFGFIGSEFNL